MSGAPLPSFVELMSSLGLSSKGHTEASTTGETRRSPSASPPPASHSPPALYVPAPSRVDDSPSIVVSHCDSTYARGLGEPRRRSSAGNIRPSRYAPYAPSMRRGSMSSMSDSGYDDDSSQTSSSTSSRRSSNASLMHPTVHPQERRLSRRSSQQLNLETSAAFTPISSFARRHSPQVSPTSPTFTSRRPRSTPNDMPTPVTLPTLPPQLAVSFAGYNVAVAVPHTDRKVRGIGRSFSPSSMDVCDVEPESKSFVRHHEKGVRISSICRPSSRATASPHSRHVTPIA